MANAVPRLNIRPLSAKRAGKAPDQDDILPGNRAEACRVGHRIGASVTTTRRPATASLGIQSLLVRSASGELELSLRILFDHERPRFLFYAVRSRGMRTTAASPI